jgi:uncharacterized protein (PEP-CTERM system associated)
MTITTANGLRLAPLAAASALLACASCHATDWKFIPSASLTETFTDNVNLQSDAQARTQWVTDATPGFALLANGPRLKLAASGQWHLFAYSNKQPETRDHQGQYQLDAKAKVIDELLFLDAYATSGPQAISAFGPQPGKDNLFALNNRTDVTTWRISPYLRQRFGHTADLTLRYTRDGVDAGARNLFGSSVGSTVNADLASGRSWHDLGWGLSYSRQELDNKLAGASSSQNATANLRYRLTPHLSATASGGYDKFDYQSLGGRTAGRSWSVGTIWTPSQRTTVQASAGRRYYGKTGSLLASLRSRHSVWTVSYSDDVTSTRQQFLLPAAIDTASMLDQLFANSIPDPVARAQAVATYMQAAGLPPALANNVNYLSNRYMRQKQLQAGAVFRGAHGDLVVSAFDTRRTGLSLQQTDSELLGSELLTLNDNVHQRGINANWTYRLSSHSDGILGLTGTRNQSLATGLASNDTLLRAGLSHRFDRKLRGAIEMRRHQGSVGAGGPRFHENALAASIFVQL